MNRHLLLVKCIVLFILCSVNALAQAPVANFTANTTSGCSPIVVHFTDLSTNSPTSWYWDLGNGNTSTLQNPSTTYINPGTYTVTLTATNSSGNNTKTITNYITVTALPVVAFIADSSVACYIPRTVSFINNSIPGGSGLNTYLWDFGDGTTSTALAPSKTYTTYGNFTVTLLITNGNGCTNSLTKTAYIKNSQKPTGSFTATGNASCIVPATVNFTNTTTGGAVSYLWDFGDGGNSTATSPSHTYTSTGSYTVKLISTNAGGCKDTFTATNFVNLGAPTADFSMPASACNNTIVNFTNNSTPAGYTSAWDFGNTGTSTANNPTNSYGSQGTYNVRLIVTKNGCSDTETKQIVINPKPIVNFTASPTNGCSVPFSTTFSNTTTGATSYLWRFGDGTTSTTAAPGKSYTLFGNYNVTLIATSSAGCVDSMVRSSYIKVQTPTATITTAPFNGCAPVSVSFTANVTTTIPVSNYSWDFGDGSSVVSCSGCNTQTHTYTSPGTYTVTLTYTTGTGCVYTATTSVQIRTKPSANFTASPTSICPGTAVTFTNSSTGTVTSYSWRFGDGGTSSATNPVYSGYSTGTYSVTLIANNGGCADTFTRNNYITVLPPNAYFTITRSCSNPLNVTVTDASTGANTYLWNFGDGTTSTQVGGSISHTYSSPGTYNIVLQVTNTSNGCTSQHNAIVTVQALTAQFSASDTTVCKGEGILFTAVSSSNIVNYYWDLGAGITYNRTTNTLGEYYTTPGIYTVKLVVTDAIGCKDSLIKTSYIRVGGPTVNFSGTPPIGCLPSTVNFTDLSTPNGGFSITNRTWNFGFGSPVSTTSSTISHLYPYTGSWNIKLVVTDANGCKDSLTKVAYITTSKPVAQFYSNDTNKCVGSTVQFVNNSGGANFTCLWHFGDGTTSTALTPSHTYNTAGNYTVKLIITDMYGCVDSVIKTAYIHIISPALSFTMSDSVANCPPLIVSFTNTSSNVSTFSWIFGNGSQSALNNPTTIYTYPGVYQVKLIGTNTAGCKDSATKNVTVNGPTGTFSYTPLNGCTPLTVNFSATTNNATSLIWDMGNGFTATTTANSYSYTYTSTGRYVPTLILSDGASCLVPLQRTDTIKVDHLDADFNYNLTNLCINNTVQFSDTILQTLSTVTTRSWTFGDGGTSTAHNPTHSYTTAGTYNVRLIVANSQGCQDTINKTIVIHGLPNVTAASNQNICAGSTTGVTITASGASTYVWTPASGLSCTTCTSPSALPSTTTTYVVTGTDIYGCVDTGNVTITIVGVPNVTASANVTICNGASTALTASGATTYSWTPTTGLSCTNCANPTANPTSTTTYIVTGSNASGCTDTAIVTVTVNPVPTVSAGSNVTICNGSSTVLTATGATSYTWSPSTGLSCTNCASPTANPATTTTYTVTGTDGNGCTNTANVIVTVNPRPTVGVSSNTSICSGNSAILTATGATSYTWSPSTGLSCTSCASPSATPTTTTTYTVTGTDGNGCTNTANVTVTVNSKPNVTASGSNVICNGNATTITASGATTYVWTPGTGLSCTTCASPSASPTNTTTYVVTGTDANGCTDTGMITITVNPKPVVSGGPNKIICNGASTSLTASGAITYTWSPSTGLSCTSCTTPTATPVTTTLYSVVGIDLNGCRDTETVQVTVNPLPIVSAGPAIAICAGSSTALSASGASSYVWSPSTGLSCTSCASPIATPSSTVTYTVTGTDANGCINTATKPITVNALPVITVGSNKTLLCYGDSAKLTVSGAASYIWTPAAGLSCTTCANPTAISYNSVTYTVIGSTNNCSDTDAVTLTIRPKVPIDAGADKDICVGDTTTLNVTGANTYVWTPASSLSCANCNNPIANPAATTTYLVTGTDADGCTGTDNVRVNVHQPPVISAGNDIDVCDGSSVRLTATGGYSYIWLPGTTLSCTTCPDPVATPLGKTTYTVVGTDNIGCKASDDVTVNVIMKIPVTVSPDVEICVGQQATLVATGGDKYIWSQGSYETSVGTIVVIPIETTKYNVIIKQGSCFTDTAYVNVIVHDLPVVELGPDKHITGGNMVELNAGTKNITTYSWLPITHLSCADCATPMASPRVNTKYTVVVSNQWGCTATDDIDITVGCDKSQIFVPNTFTPNRDGVNDYFYPQGKGLDVVQSFKVFSRWGELVFSRENMKINEPTAGWDGTYKGAPLKPDVFVYIIYALCETGEPIELKGDISLVR